MPSSYAASHCGLCISGRFSRDSDKTYLRLITILWTLRTMDRPIALAFERPTLSGFRLQSVHRRHRMLSV